MEIVPNIADKINEGVRQEQVQKKKNEFHFIGDERKVKGHTLFAYNTVTKEIKPAPINESVSIGMDLQPVYQHRVCVKKDCIYVQALNAKNALKKLKREGAI